MAIQKIEIGKLITQLVNEAKEIEKLDIQQRDKTAKFQRLAIKFMNSVYGDGRKRQEAKIKLSTARSYLTKARKAIAEFTGIHHRYESEVARLAKRYPGHSALILPMAGLDKDSARIAKKELLNTLMSATDLKENVEELDFSSRNIKSQVKKLAEKYSDYAPVILPLAGDDPLAEVNALMVTLREADALYGDIKKLKIDHELIVNLAMSDKDKDILSQTASQRLKVKKVTKVHVNYPKYLSDVQQIFYRPDWALTGDRRNVAPLIFAIAAVTGRRPIEVIYTGQFKPVGFHSIEFSGQTKKRDDNTESFTIYSLVDSELVAAAVAKLRQTPQVKELVNSVAGENDYRSTNKIINSRIADVLNEFAKEFFNDKRRVFKDSRGIYGRICYERWYKTDPRWRDKDEDIFFSELFGHSDTDSQSHYKPYQLKDFDGAFEPKQTGDSRLEQLCKLDDEMPELARGDAAVKIHNWVKDEVMRNQNVLITQSAISAKTKVYRETIKRYLHFIGDLATGGEPISEQVSEAVDADDQNQNEPAQDQTSKAEVKAEVKTEPKQKKSKPHISAKLLDEDVGHWQIIVKLGDKTGSYDLYSSSKVEAMKTGYALFIGDVFKYRVEIHFTKHPCYSIDVIASNKAEAQRQAFGFAKADGLSGNHRKVDINEVK